MDERDDEQLDSAFLALADPVRHRIISRLSRGRVPDLPRSGRRAHPADRPRGLPRQREARDGMAQSGMEGGVTEGYERLDDILAGATV